MVRAWNELSLQLLDSDGWLWEVGPLTFSPHAHLETLLEPTVLALVPVVLINGTVPVASTRVRKVSPYTPLEEALATCNKEHLNYKQRFWLVEEATEDGQLW
jgi:hypothetical protein